MDEERVGQRPLGEVSAGQLQTMVQMIKWWLAMLTVLILGLCTVYVAHPLPMVGRPASPAVGPTTPGPVLGDGAWSGKVSTSSIDGERTVEGPWGRLEIAPFTLPASGERFTDYPPVLTRDVVWYFRCADLAELSDVLAQADLPYSVHAMLTSRAVRLPQKDGGGYGMCPGRELILSLSPESRAKLYLVLHDDPRNIGQIAAFRFLGNSVEQWFQNSRISPATVKLVAPLVYRHGRVLLFADAATVWPMLPSDAERQKLFETMTRMKTLQIKLALPSDSDIGPLADYWGQAGRREEVRQHLASARRRGDRDIDITQLLPRFARQRIYTYPTLQMVRSDVHYDCHWTAVNFLSEKPDDQLDSPGRGLEALTRGYHEVSGRPQFGDWVIFFTADGTPIHSAVHIAANVLFTKNGSGMTAWMFIECDYLKDCYPQPKKLTVRYFRRRE